MSGLPQSYGTTYPTAGGGVASPYPPSASSYAAVSPTQQQQIQPGSITYTTTTLSDGRIQYNQFRAEARSYQTPQGPVHGIQWIPVNATHELPSNAYPAGPDFHASWSRPGNDKDTHRAIRDWQRDQEKRAKKEEKESARRMKEWEKERREREKAEAKELRKTQELDLQRGGRQRRLSDAGYGVDFPTYSAPTSAYPRARSRSRVRRDSVGQDELTRAMAEMAMEKEWAASETDNRWGRERERRHSNVGRPRKVSINERPGALPPSDYERTRRLSGTPHPTSGYSAGAYPSYGRAPSPARATYTGRTSPYVVPGGLPPTGGVPVYPPGHIYAGKPIPGMQGDSLGMGGSYAPPSPRRSIKQLESPASFSRLPSVAQPYTYFEPILIMADLNELFQRTPSMPPVLGPHDVWPEDWARCLQDVASVWFGEMPIKERQRSLKPHHVVSQLIDLWNANFFSLRGTELVLFRGRQRRSGPQAGRYDPHLGFEASSEDESDTISSVSSDSDADDKYGFYGGAHARYGAHGSHWMADSREARRARRAERKLREKQKRKRHEREREKEKGSGYSLYLICTNDGQPPRPPYASSGYPG